MIDVSSSLENVTKDRYQLIIGTHNGIFHPDETFACAVLGALYFNKSILILRTREKTLLKQCDICVDIGGGRYDHHQLGFNETRKNGTIYASAGLVWNEYGKPLIDCILNQYFTNIKCHPNLINYIFKTFDENFVIPVDLEDNGKKTEKHCFSFINSFLPLYFHNSSDDFNKQFYKALVATIEVFEQKLSSIIGQQLESNLFETKLSNSVMFNILLQNRKAKLGKILGKVTIHFRYHNSNYFNNGILEIPSQTLDWKATIVKINASMYSKKINFVIFPYPDGGWAAQCVPPSLENEMAQRMSFPLQWAGQTENLPVISGVEGAILCHNYRFFARAKDKQSIIQMCNIATSYNSKSGEP